MGKENLKQGNRVKDLAAQGDVEEGCRNEVTHGLEVVVYATEILAKFLSIFYTLFNDGFGMTVECSQGGRGL
jgi:hypothetical protein